MSNKTDLEILIRKNIFTLKGVQSTDTITPFISCDPLKVFNSKVFIFHATGKTLYSRTDYTEYQLTKQISLLYKYIGVNGAINPLERDIAYHLFIEKCHKSLLSPYLCYKKDTREVVKAINCTNALAMYSLMNECIEEYIRWCYGEELNHTNALILPTPILTNLWSVTLDRLK